MLTKLASFVGWLLQLLVEFGLPTVSRFSFLFLLLTGFFLLLRLVFDFLLYLEFTLTQLMRTVRIPTGFIHPISTSLLWGYRAVLRIYPNLFLLFVILFVLGYLIPIFSEDLPPRLIQVILFWEDFEAQLIDMSNIR